MKHINAQHPCSVPAPIFDVIRSGVVVVFVFFSLFRCYFFLHVHNINRVDHWNKIHLDWDKRTHKNTFLFCSSARFNGNVIPKPESNHTENCFIQMCIICIHDDFDCCFWVNNAMRPINTFLLIHCLLFSFCRTSHLFLFPFHNSSFHVVRISFRLLIATIGLCVLHCCFSSHLVRWCYMRSEFVCAYIYVCIYISICIRSTHLL